jgi:hypothetical protein
MNRQYEVYVNGILARKFLTLNKAVECAMKYFPSYIVKNNAVIWKGV